MERVSMQWHCHGKCCWEFFSTGAMLPFLNKKDGIMRLLSKVFSLFFSLSFPIKAERLSFFVCINLYLWQKSR